jgi:hypothetical protein
LEYKEREDLFFKTRHSFPSSSSIGLFFYRGPPPSSPLTLDNGWLLFTVVKR